VDASKNGLAKTKLTSMKLIEYQPSLLKNQKKSLSCAHLRVSLRKVSTHFSLFAVRTQGEYVQLQGKLCASRKIGINYPILQKESAA